MTIESRVNFRVSMPSLVSSLPSPPQAPPKIYGHDATCNSQTRTKSKRGTNGIAGYVQFLNFRLWSVKYKVRYPFALCLSKNYGMLMKIKGKGVRRPQFF